MSLSYKGEENQFAPRTSFDVYGKDLLKTTDGDFAPHLNRSDPVQEEAPVNYVPPTIRQPVEEPAPPKEKKKCWLLRPVAWFAFILSVYLMNAIFNTTILLIDCVVDWLSTLPTMAVVLLTLAFGSLAIGLIFTGTLRLVVWIVSASHAIYPSKNGVRFYIVGTVQLLISLLAIVLVITDSVSTHTFWDFAAPIYFAIVYIGMMCGVKSLID